MQAGHRQKRSSWNRGSRTRWQAHRGCQLKRRGEGTEIKTGKDILNNVRELHTESGRKEISVSEALTLPHCIKFSALSVIHLQVKKAKLNTFL